MGLLDGIGRAIGLTRDRIETGAELAAFIDSRAAFLAQKCVVEFCRVRAGVYWQKLFSEKDFQLELSRSRWRSYPAAYGMIAEMVEASLRPEAGVRRLEIPERLVVLAATTFAAYPVPEGEGDGFWRDAEALVRETLLEARALPARPVREMPKPLARKVFDALPLHKTIVTNDYDYIFNNLRMNLLRAHEEFVAMAAPKPLLVDLLGDDPQPQASI
ncbi:MAG: hypothetical protein KF810_20615 [Rhizobiaceae bacterium]|nr:hypothetical protein [Rhizobiaceae bacterium]